MCGRTGRRSSRPRLKRILQRSLARLEASVTRQREKTEEQVSVCACFGSKRCGFAGINSWKHTWTKIKLLVSFVLRERHIPRLHLDSPFRPRILQEHSADDRLLENCVGSW